MTKPDNHQRVLCLFESPHTGVRQWYAATYINGRFTDGVVTLNNIIAWTPCPPTDLSVGMLLTVPCFTSGRDVVVHGEKPVEVCKRSNRPRYIHKVGDRWDRSNDGLLIHWFTVRRFTVSEITRRTDYSHVCIRSQLKRLGLYETKRVEWNSAWNRYILDGLSGAEIAKLTGVSQSCVSKQRKRLNLEPARLVEWTDTHSETLRELWESPRNTIDVIAIEMGTTPRTITKYARLLGLRRR